MQGRHFFGLSATHAKCINIFFHNTNLSQQKLQTITYEMPVKFAIL